MLMDTVFSVCYIVFGLIAIVLNGLLLYIVIERAPFELSLHRYFIGNAALTNLIIAVLFLLYQPRVVPLGWTNALISLGIVPDWLCFGTLCILVALNLHIFTSLALSFGYKFSVICLARANSKRTSRIIVITLLLSILSKLCLFGYLTTTQRKKMTYIALANRLKVPYDFSQYHYGITTDDAESLFSTYAIIIVALFSINIVVIVFFGFKIQRCFKSNQQHLRKGTLALQTRLVRTLYMQTVTPAIIISLAAILYAFRNFGLLPGELCEHLPMFLLQKLTIIGPIIDLFGIRSFRHSIKDLINWSVNVTSIEIL